MVNAGLSTNQCHIKIIDEVFIKELAPIFAFLSIILVFQPKKNQSV